MTDRAAALPPTLFAYVLRVSGRHQIALLLLSVAVFGLSAVPLEIQRRLVNDAINRGLVSSIVWLALAYFGVALAEGAVKLGLNIYRSWVSETAVLDLRRNVSALTAGVGKVNDPWGDLVNWFREVTAVRMRYRLLTDAMAVLGRAPGSAPETRRSAGAGLT